MLFPMIARQMQPGLEKLFQDFEVSFQKYKPLPAPPPSPRSVASGTSSSKNSAHSSVNGDLYKQAADESEVRRSLESAIMTAVDLFQKVDQSQLNLLASSTDLTGPAVDRLIERYVAEQLHDSILFPRICATKSIEDDELEHKILDMANVDLTQVGIPSLDQQEKKSLVHRLDRGIKSFAKISTAKSPHAMTEYLLETAQTLTRLDDDPSEELDPCAPPTKDSLEKSTVVTMNADMLVSLLLIIVIRAKVPNLHACLSYMRNFIFAEDVEQGETGYVLSTLEAVLFHIAQDHALSAASRSNERLWRGVREGDLDTVRRLLEPAGGGRSRASSRVRSDDGVEERSGSEGSRENEGEAVGDAGAELVPTVLVYSPVREQTDGFIDEPQKVSETNGDSESEASASSEEGADEGLSHPTEANDVTTGDDITNHDAMDDADENSKTPGEDNEPSSNGTTVTNDEPSPDESLDEPLRAKVKKDDQEEMREPPVRSIAIPLAAVEALDEEVYTDPFETVPAESSSLAGSISPLTAKTTLPHSCLLQFYRRRRRRKRELAPMDEWELLGSRPMNREQPV